MEEISLPLMTIAPLVGGTSDGVRSTGDAPNDEFDLIRAPAVRGHLRFWWRALHFGRSGPDGVPLGAADERRLFGGVSGDARRPGAARSLVEVRTRVHSPSEILKRPVGEVFREELYALWPLAMGGGVSAVRMPGVRFVISLRFPRARRTEVLDSLRAWLLFGGYGGRTRRGYGALTLDDLAPAASADRRLWLPDPRNGIRQGLTALFDRDPLEPRTGGDATDTPALAGAWLTVKQQSSRGADEARRDALGALRTFRQGSVPEKGPRQVGPRGRPGRSSWPEADKARWCFQKWAAEHQPRHGERPVWPRAGFGLPMQFRWQRKNRHRQPYGRPEPDDFWLVWESEDGQIHERLASPLIVKAMPLADGRFHAIALWLSRAYPRRGIVGIELRTGNSGSRLREGSEVDFDEIVAPGDDSATFLPLRSARNEASGNRLRNAFMRWLESGRGWRRVSP